MNSKRKKNKFDDNRETIKLAPKTVKQSEYITALLRADQIVVLGPAGTGKTYVAATYAAQQYAVKNIDKIILTRPNIAAGKSLGFFPGTLDDKMAPWMMPVVEVLNKHLGRAVVDIAMKNGNIELAPFETMRGRSFENAFVLLDEAQNTTLDELKMFLTRVGENTKVILNGDVSQTDLKENSGLKKIIHMVKSHMLPIPVVEFGVEDIVRSDLCKLWIETFIKEGIN